MKCIPRVMVGNDSDDATEKKYFDLLSWGGFTVPSIVKWQSLYLFCYIDYADKFIVKHNESTSRESAERILETYFPKYVFTCEQHTDKGIHFAA